MEGRITVSEDERALAAEEAAGLMRALSNPSRMLIVCLLSDGDLTVGEIENELNLGQAYVSQQLARLREDGIVAATREGRQMRYRIADPRVRPVMAAIHASYGSPA